MEFFYRLKIYGPLLIIVAIYLVFRAKNRRLEERIEDLEERIRTGSTGDSFQGETRAEQDDKDWASLESQTIALLREQRKVEAIKNIKDSKNIGLKEAKDYVDRIEEENF